MTAIPVHRLIIALGIGVASCQPATTRPVFAPLPEAASVEIRLNAAPATRYLADALRGDSIPLAKVQQRDGYLESGWFAYTTGTPVKGRPIGTDVVQVRAWIDRGRPFFSLLTVETVYRPLADPSLPERELEQPVADDHPIAVKIRATLDTMVKKFGGPPAMETTRPSTP